MTAPRTPRFITVDEAIAFQEIAIAKYGGAIGLRDRGLLESALAQPRQQFGGEYAHEFPFGMAAAYAFFIAKNHPFFDGNKRAALLCAGAFLRMNGWSLESDGVEAADQIIALVESKIDRDGFAMWLKGHSRPLPSMELREFFSQVTDLRLLDHQRAAKIDPDPVVGLSASLIEAAGAMPLIHTFMLHAASASTPDEQRHWTSQLGLLTALHRIAEDMGYEW